MPNLSDDRLKIERAARNEVSRENLQAHIDYLCSLGEKLAGTGEEAKACSYIVDELTKAGLKATVHEFESYISHPISAVLSIYFPEKMEIEGVGVSFGVSTPDQGLSAEVIHVGGGADDDYSGIDVRGKIVLVDKLPTSSF